MCWNTGKTFVGLNIMWTHLEQRSFKLTEAQVWIACPPCEAAAATT